MPHPPDDSVPDRFLGGYRLLRVLGEGSRARVHLAQDAAGVAVALRVPHAMATAEEVHRGLRALALSQGAHVVRLLDVAAGARGRPVVVLERLAGPSLSALLVERDRDRFDPGEAVTLLAPLAGALDRAHAAGVAHGALRPASVLLDARGAPQLIGFGAARLLHPTPAAVETHPALIGDRAGLRSIAAAVLERTGIRDVDDFLGPADPEFAARLAERLFDWAPAAPIRAAGAPPRSLPTRIAPAWEGSGAAAGIERDAGPRVAAERGDGRSAPAAPTLAARVKPALRAWLGVESPADRLRALVIDQLRVVRRPVWVAAGAVAIAATLAAVLLPALDGDDGVQATDVAPVADDRGRRAGGDGASPAGAAPRDASSGPSASSWAGDPDLADPEQTAVLGDDPVRAAPVLLRARERCFRDLSVGCLDAVDQRDGDLKREDAAAIGAAADGGELPPLRPAGIGPVELTQRLGDTALVGVRSATGEAVPMLLVRTSEGWRLRSFTQAAAG